MALDPKFFPPTAVELLIVDSRKSKKMRWEPKYNLAGLVKAMVASDLKILKRIH